MTPTLMGRWQTRVFLMALAGLPLTLLYMVLFGAFDPPWLAVWKLPTLLAWVTGLGLAWDLLWIYLQSFRWDRDWPLAFQFGAGVLEGVVVFVLFAAGVLPGADYTDGDWWRFGLHYGTIFVVTYWVLFGPMKVLFPRWRFRGGQLV